MIHYTLLPKEEMRVLRREYRLRLFIIASFFISCAIVGGIMALIPSYLYSSTQEVGVLRRVAAFQADRKASGADHIEKELIETQGIAKKILAIKIPFTVSESIQKILSYKSPQLSLSSFNFTASTGTSTAYEGSISGKAVTRETLLDFKNGLENDPTFSKIDLPLSDLAKSKNINFSLKLVVQQPKK